ncbi:MAG: amidase domain-containing protein [Oscillospiraceae bacterium]|nr:amidase domain-containing protein [Oscillospiraceae bacterium]
MKILLILLFSFIAGMWVWNGYIHSEYYTADSSARAQTAVSLPGTASAKDVEVNVAVNDRTGILNERQKELLAAYARNYADTLCTLEAQDISGLFTKQDKSRYINMAAQKILVEIRKMSHLDLTLSYASVSYNISEVKVSGSTVTVYLTEENVQRFQHLTEDSCSYNINHKFVLEETDGSWLIKSHEQEEDFFLLAVEGWENASGADYTARAEKTVELITADALENKEVLKISTGNPPEDIEVKNTAYDRDAAVEYARQWCNQRNYTGNYLAYDDYGGNCQNFASQCIYAGGIDMDYSGYGESQWKFYSRTLNTKQTATGRSYSWTGVDPFYTYATINRSNGLICQADLRLEYAEKGDVIQVGAYNDWRHSLVVTDTVYDRNGNMIDITVASNTADRWNYPLSAYIYTYPRLIHILGQN